MKILNLAEESTIQLIRKKSQLEEEITIHKMTFKLEEWELDLFMLPSKRTKKTNYSSNLFLSQTIRVAT